MIKSVFSTFHQKNHLSRLGYEHTHTHEPIHTQKNQSMKVFEAMKKRDEAETQTTAFQTIPIPICDHHITLAQFYFIFIIPIKSNAREKEQKTISKRYDNRPYLSIAAEWKTNLYYILYFVQAPMMTIAINWIFTLLCVRWINVRFFLHSSCAPRITHLTLYIFYATINHFPCCFWRSPFIFYYYVQYNNVKLH